MGTQRAANSCRNVKLNRKDIAPRTALYVGKRSPEVNDTCSHSCHLCLLATLAGEAKRALSQNGEEQINYSETVRFECPRS